jgi:hypothetical protein
VGVLESGLRLTFAMRLERTGRRVIYHDSVSRLETEIFRLYLKHGRMTILYRKFYSPAAEYGCTVSDRRPTTLIEGARDPKEFLFSLYSMPVEKFFSRWKSSGYDGRSRMGVYW